MKPAEMVAKLQQENPKLMANIPAPKATRIIKEALAQLRDQIGGMDEGAVKVLGFGNFRVRSVEREKDGVKAIVKNVFFRTAKAKAPGEKGVGSMGAGAKGAGAKDAGAKGAGAKGKGVRTGKKS